MSDNQTPDQLPALDQVDKCLTIIQQQQETIEKNQETIQECLFLIKKLYGKPV